MNECALSETTQFEQVFLLDRDAGLLCRILGLYAARGMEVLHVSYAHTARDLMALTVCVSAASESADAVRVLVAKASTLLGVVSAHECARQGGPSPSA